MIDDSDSATGSSHSDEALSSEEEEEQQQQQDEEQIADADPAADRRRFKLSLLLERGKKIIPFT